MLRIIKRTSPCKLRSCYFDVILTVHICRSELSSNLHTLLLARKKVFDDELEAAAAQQRQAASLQGNLPRIEGSVDEQDSNPFLTYLTAGAASLDRENSADDDGARSP